MMKNNRFDGASGATEIMQTVAGELPKPPEHCRLQAKHMPFWNALMVARGGVKWTDADLEIAALAARCKCKIEELEIRLEREGDIIINARGTQIANPLHQILETHCRRMVSLSRMLHVHAEATSGKSKKEKGRNGAAGDMRDVIEDMEDDGLIPGLGAH